MKLKEHTIRMINNINKFEVYWDHNNNSDPENFPLDLDEGDWLEHFMLWLGSEKED